MYTSTTTLYVLHRSSDSTDVVSYNDILTSNLLMADYSQLAQSKRVRDAVAAEVGLDSLDGYDVKVSFVEDTQVIKIAVEGKNPDMAANIANNMAKEFSSCVIEIMQVLNVNVVDPAVAPTTPSGPLKERNIILSGLVALAVAVGIALAIEMLNTTIRTEDDVENQLGLPVLAVINKFNESSRGK
jgi:capsular polysaccharide biosynthesis protein